MFDIKNFLAVEVTEANSTSVIPVPEGEWVACITAVTPREIKTKDGEQRFLFDVTWKITEDEVRNITDRAEPTVRQSIWLDITPAGTLDMGKGKNTGLGRLRAAMGQNVPGQAWSPQHLVGQVGRVSVKHRMDQRDESVVLADVTAVSAL